MEDMPPISSPPVPAAPSTPKPSGYTVRWIWRVSLGLGIAADCLLRHLPLGLNVPCFTLLFGIVMAWGWHRHKEHSPCWNLLAFAGLLSLGIAFRDTPVLTQLNLGTIGILLFVLTARPTRTELHSGPLTSLVINGKNALGHMLAAPIQLLGMDTDWSQSNQLFRGTRSKPMARALLLALPLLVVFTWLFAAADAVFKSSLESLGQHMSDLFAHGQTLALHAMWSLIFFVLVTMILRPMTLGTRWKPDPITVPESFTVGTLEIATVLGSLLALFLCFIIIQVRYLFGGTTLVQNVAGLTYADYARQGFFALLKVVFLLHLVLMAGSWLVKEACGATRKLFRGLSLGLVAGATFIFASAFFRLYLYVDAYGLTRARFYAVAILIWLGLVFLFFTVKLVWTRWSLFTGAYVHAFLGVLLLLNVMNPDAMITRINLDRYLAGRQLDQSYLGTLSYDALPTLMEYRSRVTDPIITDIVNAIESHRLGLHQQDWRNWNYARSKWHKLTSRANTQ